MEIKSFYLFIKEPLCSFSGGERDKLTQSLSVRRKGRKIEVVKRSLSKLTGSYDRSQGVLFLQSCVSKCLSSCRFCHSIKRYVCDKPEKLRLYDSCPRGQSRSKFRKSPSILCKYEMGRCRRDPRWKKHLMPSSLWTILVVKAKFADS